MSNFRFLHAADIHLDSPMRGLARYDGVPVEEVRGATRAAFDRLIQFAVDEAVDFVVISGDLFDGDWRDMGTGLHFARGMGALERAGIPAYVLSGNHDAASVVTKSLPWPDTVHRFDSRKPQTFRLPDIGVALHGQSFHTQHVFDDLAATYPPPEAGLFNIGVLHTALGGAPGHAPYAPSSIAALQAKRYDYWALGHVHDHQQLSQEPWIVFPGNLQGRNIRETGPKGAVLVEVHDRQVANVQFIPFDGVRWSLVTVDCRGADRHEDVTTAIREALTAAHLNEANGRPLMVRVVLVGETALAGDLQDGAAQLRAEVQALGMAISPDLWLEKVRVDLVPPTLAVSSALPEDLASLLADASQDAGLADFLSDELRAFLTGLPTREEGDEGDELTAAAVRQDWSRLLNAAAESLPARLTGKR